MRAAPGVQPDAASQPTIAAALFRSPVEADAAVQRLRAAGLSGSQVRAVSASSSPSDLASLAPTSGATDLATLLVAAGLPDGEARFYTGEVQRGSVLVVARPSSGVAEVQRALRAAGGDDVRARGAALVEGDSGREPDAPTGAAPADLTDRWEDVASRYEMLWAQHYGAEGGEWADAEPVYRFAWEVANRPDLRGRAWQAVEPSVRQAWQQAGGGRPWNQVRGAVEDVWRDVADEAHQPEGGAARRVERPQMPSRE